MSTRWLVLVGFALSRAAYSFQLQSMAVVASGLAQDLGLNVASIGTLIGVMMLPGVFIAIPGSLLSQWIGERRFMLFCLSAMVVGGLICGLGHSFGWMVAGRLIAGVGAVGISVIGNKIVADWFVGKEISTAMAINVAGFPAGIALALVTLGHLATPEAWPVAFFAAAGVSFAALVVFALTYRSAEAAETGHAAGAKLSLGETGMVSLAGLIFALQNAMVIITVSFVPLFLLSEGMTAATAASIVGIGLWVTILSVPIGGIIVDKVGSPNVVIIVGMLIGRLGILLVIPFADSIPALLALMAILTFIGTLPSGPMLALTTEVLRPGTRAAGMGVSGVWLYGALSLGPIMAGLVSDTAGDPSAPIYLVGALAIVTVLVLGLFRALQARGLPAVMSSDNS
jgi:MFS family permease